MLDVLPAQSVGAPMREFLAWVARSPRSYDDAMGAWQSHCPRFTVWEDALAAELIEVAGARVQLTARGISTLATG